MITEKLSIEKSQSISDWKGENYFKTMPKLLWILKEQTQLGGWDIGKFMNTKNNKDLAGPTYLGICYTSYCLLHDFSLFDKIIEKKIKNEVEERIRIFKSIGIINVKKNPENSRTSTKILNESYKNYKLDLLKQIEEYQPDIIIGGGTLQLFREELGLTIENHLSKPFPHHFKLNRLLIEASHPSYPSFKKITIDTYVNSIIQIAKEWKNKRNSPNNK